MGQRTTRSQPLITRDLPNPVEAIQLVVGLVLFGAGLGLVVLGGNGQGPWTVWDEGIANHTPLSLGTVSVLTGFAIFAIVAWLREPMGLGTLLNILIIGPSTDATLWLFDEPDHWLSRAMLTIVGPFVVAIGSSLYLGVHLGPGPRDGLMTALNARGWSIGRARFGIEFVAFAVGAVLGGTIGWGTVWWLICIGPFVQLTMPWFDRGTR